MPFLVRPSCDQVSNQSWSSQFPEVDLFSNAEEPTLNEWEVEVDVATSLFWANFPRSAKVVQNLADDTSTRRDTETTVVILSLKTGGDDMQTVFLETAVMSMAKLGGLCSELTHHRSYRLIW